MIPVLVFVLNGCQPAGSPPSAALRPTASPLSIEEPDEIQQFQSSSGLTILESRLKASPEVEPLRFDPVEGSQEEILANHADERQNQFQDNSFFDGNQFCRKQTLGDQSLLAKEVLADSPVSGYQKISVELYLDGKSIQSFDAGFASPVQALQGLWVDSEGHWLLEIAKTTLQATPGAFDAWVIHGQVYQDGKSVNDRNGYQESFGSQLINEKPFYFFVKDGEIGFSYAGKPTLLGYDEVSHYQCCSGSALNPQRAQNMVSFFARKGATWYEVEIGDFR